MIFFYNFSVKKKTTKILKYSDEFICIVNNIDMLIIIIIIKNKTIYGTCEFFKDFDLTCGKARLEYFRISYAKVRSILILIG